MPEPQLYARLHRTAAAATMPGISWQYPHGTLDFVPVRSLAEASEMATAAAIRGQDSDAHLGVLGMRTRVEFFLHASARNDAAGCHAHLAYRIDAALSRLGLASVGPSSAAALRSGMSKGITVSKTPCA